MTRCRPLYLLVLVILLRLLGLLVPRQALSPIDLVLGLVRVMQGSRLSCRATNLSSFRPYLLLTSILRQTILLSEVDPAPDRTTESISRIADVL